ncbi:hypothetical protein AB62_4681 [Escherichia coli 2-210-07_S1_C3]|nr:hypothetical protein AB62_4681 [Escherichia coli 2-210-07_S1_C3]
MNIAGIQINLDKLCIITKNKKKKKINPACIIILKNAEGININSFV